MTKYPEAASVAQQVYRVLIDVENLAGSTPAKVGESSEWTSVVNGAEENRANFRKGLDGKPLFSALYIMYMVTLNEMKRHISNNTSQRAKKSAKPVLTSAAIKLPLEIVLTRNFFAPLRTTDMDTEVTEAEDTLPEQETDRR
jgi:hypothetical protein